jgi:hypothetical protein
LWSIHLSDGGRVVAPVGKFYVAHDLIVELEPEERGRYLETMLRGAPLLVIYDVGAEQEIPFVNKDPRHQQRERQARYLAVVNYCYEHGIGLVITANMQLDGLREHIGGRAFSRLMEMAPSGQVVDLTGVPDYRKKLGGRG